VSKAIHYRNASWPQGHYQYRAGLHRIYRLTVLIDFRRRPGVGDYGHLHIDRPAHCLRRPRFYSTTAGTSSATITSTDTLTVLSSAAKVKPTPEPPMSICAFSIALRRVQANSASESSKWCLWQFIRSPGRPETRVEKSSLHCDRASSVSLPGIVLLSIVIERSKGLVKVARLSQSARYQGSAQTGAGLTFQDY
jgi:hypothetical protein